MEQVINLLVEAGLEILGLILTALIVWIGYHLEQWIKVSKNAKQLESKEEYAYLAVAAVELAFTGFGGDIKFDKAKDRILAWTQKHKIPIAESELDTLIDSAVKQLKEEGREIKAAYGQALEEE